MTAGNPPRSNVIQAATFPSCSAGRLYAAAAQAVGELGFALTSRNDATLSIAFRPATPTGSWPYEQMTAVVRAERSAARIVFEGTPVGGGWTQMGGWREGNRIAIMILDRLKSVMARFPEAAAEAPASSSSADQLAALTDLRDRGLLTDAEFEAEKRRLSGA